MNEILNAFGVKKVFTVTPDFSPISNHQVYVSSVIHQAHIEVDEEGTEAAAVTVVQMKCKSLNPPDPTFHVNRPFHFHIVDSQNQVILFSGTIHEPKYE